MYLHVSANCRYDHFGNAVGELRRYSAITILYAINGRRALLCARLHKTQLCVTQYAL